MPITCFIRYQIHPYERDAFASYASNWGQAIPRCGADPTGYFAPHEGAANKACGACSVDGLAAYESYRARLAADPLGQETYAFAARERFILRAARIFLKLASAPLAAGRAPDQRGGAAR